MIYAKVLLKILDFNFVFRSYKIFYHYFAEDHWDLTGSVHEVWDMGEAQVIQVTEVDNSYCFLFSLSI